jgi:hypothetical protein
MVVVAALLQWQKQHPKGVGMMVICNGTKMWYHHHQPLTI